MAALQETVVFDVHDAKVYSLSTDLVGASPTYGAAVDIPGIADVSLEPNLVTAELKGDARIIAKKGRIDRFNFSATYGRLSLPVQLVTLGGTVATAGAGAAEIAEWIIASPAPMPYFALEFKIEDLDEGLGSVNVRLFKCQITGSTMITSSSDNFGQPTLQCEAIALNGTVNKVDGTPVEGAMASIKFYETNTALSA